MAVGLVSSTSNRTAQAAAPAILRSGEKQASTREALKNPNAKVYLHQVAGAKFIMPDGLELQFLGGRLVTDDAGIIAELDKVANKTTSLIFTEKAGLAAAQAVQNAAAADASDTAGTLSANS
jgi:hypothetical protein